MLVIIMLKFEYSMKIILLNICLLRACTFDEFFKYENINFPWQKWKKWHKY